MGFDQKAFFVAVIAVLLSGMWARFADGQSEECRIISSDLESCIVSMQSGTYMQMEMVCCSSMKALEKKIQNAKLSRQVICECLKGFEYEKQNIFNEYLVEVQILCGPQVPYPITAYTDCSAYAKQLM
eukprot:Gb_03342 [translate_table: standard]